MSIFLFINQIHEIQRVCPSIFVVLWLSLRNVYECQEIPVYAI